MSKCWPPLVAKNVPTSGGGSQDAAERVHCQVDAAYEKRTAALSSSRQQDVWIWEPIVVCNYCGCRAIEPIADLTAEHVRILSLSGRFRRAVASSEHVAAAGLLQMLHGVLEVHDAVEELALYPAMARQVDLRDKIGTLFDQHDELDRVISQALTAVERGGPGTADWAAVLRALEMLAEHIDHEEHGLFPAAALSLDPADWEYAAVVRARQTARPEPPTEPSVDRRSS